MISIDANLFSDGRYQGIYHLHSKYKNVINLINQNHAIVSIVNASISKGPGRIHFEEDIDFLTTNEYDNLHIHKQNLNILDKSISYELWKTKNLKLSFNYKKAKHVILYLEEKLQQREKELFDKYSKVDQLIVKTIKENLQHKQLETLLGFGMGLTPLGDDCVFGYLFGMNIFDKSTMNIYPIAQKKTTLVSSEFLYHMNQQRVSDKLYKLRNCLFLDNEISDDLVSDVMHYGNSSGYGILLGLKSYLERRIQNV